MRIPRLTTKLPPSPQLHTHVFLSSEYTIHGGIVLRRGVWGGPDYLQQNTHVRKGVLTSKVPCARHRLYTHTSRHTTRTHTHNIVETHCYLLIPMEGHMHQFVYRVMQQPHRTSSGHFSHRCLLLTDSLSGCRRPLWLKRPELVQCGCYVTSLTNQYVHVPLFWHSHMPNHASLLVACTVNVCCMNTFCRQTKKCGSLLTDHIKFESTAIGDTASDKQHLSYTWIHTCTYVRWYNIMHTYTAYYAYIYTTNNAHECTCILYVYMCMHTYNYIYTINTAHTVRIHITNVHTYREWCIPTRTYALHAACSRQNISPVYVVSSLHQQASLWDTVECLVQQSWDVTQHAHMSLLSLSSSLSLGSEGATSPHWVARG